MRRKPKEKAIIPTNIVARLISHDKSVSFLTDSLLGVLKGDYSEESIKAERMRKYESID